MPYVLFLVLWLAFNLIFGALCAFWANRWGRDPFAWLLVGAVLGPMAPILLVVEHRRDLRRPRPSLATSGTRTGVQAGPRVLVAVDGSPWSDQAVKHVVEHHGDALAEVSVVSVLPIERADGVSSEEGLPRRQLLKEEIERHLGSACAALHKAGIACKSIVRFGDPAQEILRLAQEMECDLIVIGRRGRGRAAKLLLGSVSEKVAKEAGCPVTVVG